MKIKDLPLNDEYAQYIKSMNRTPEDAILKRTNMQTCKHLFIKLKEKTYITDQKYNHIIVECLHCGLTNKYRMLEDFFRIKEIARKPYNERTIETKVYMEIIKDESDLPLISEEVLATNHPRLLYFLAKTIEPTAQDNELFTIMNELNNLETPEEKQRLRTYEQASSLLNRYQKTKTKTLTKTKK